MRILPITTLAYRQVSRIIARNAFRGRSLSTGSLLENMEEYASPPMLFLVAQAEQLDKERERCSCHRLNDD